MHTTNYFNTFIEIAEDCPVPAGVIPPVKGDKQTVANLQFALLHEHPYEYTSDDVLFLVFAQRNGLAEAEWEDARARFFAKGQPCFRASPLPKSYGWGVHNNAEGKIALVDAGSVAYQALIAEQAVTKVKAMRSKRK